MSNERLGFSEEEMATMPKLYGIDGKEYTYQDVKRNPNGCKDIVLYKENGDPAPRNGSGGVYTQYFTAPLNARKGGRPKGVAAKLREQFTNDLASILAQPGNGRKIVQKAIEQAKEGNKDAREWLYNRAYGRVPQQVDIQDDSRREELESLRGALTYMMLSEEDKAKVRAGEGTITVESEEDTPQD